MELGGHSGRAWELCQLEERGEAKLTSCRTAGGCGVSGCEAGWMCTWLNIRASSQAVSSKLHSPSPCNSSEFSPFSFPSSGLGSEVSIPHQPVPSLPLAWPLRPRWRCQSSAHGDVELALSGRHVETGKPGESTPFMCTFPDTMVVGCF